MVNTTGNSSSSCPACGRQIAASHARAVWSTARAWLVVQVLLKVPEHVYQDILGYFSR